jgi:hypothetical protein
MAGAIGRESNMKFIVCAATAVFLLWATPARAVDEDGDGVDDSADNCVPPGPGVPAASMYNPDQDDTDGDFCGNVCDADFPIGGVNPGNGTTNVYDVLYMLPLGTVDPVHDMTEPIGDTVNIFDVLQLLNWLNGPPVAAPAGPSGTTPGTTFCP